MSKQQQNKYSNNFIQWTLLFILLPALTLTIYSNTLRSPFVLDDLSCIQYNNLLHIEKITPKSLWNAAFALPINTRPVANISFAFNYYFSQGENLVSLHLTNIGIHILNGILLYFFVLSTLKTPVLKKTYLYNCSYIPLLTALLWIVHPLHTQSVTYIVQRMNSLAALFYLLSFICYIAARFSKKKPSTLLLTAASFIAGGLAFGTKEISVTLPIFIVFYEFFFFQDINLSWLKRKKTFLITLCAGIVILFFFKFGLFFWETIPTSYAHRNFSLSERLLTEPRVILLYLSLLFFPLPSRLNLEHDFQLSHSLIDPVTTLPAILFLLLLILLAVLLCRKERLLAFTIFWFLGNLLLESSFIPLEIIFEHRTYLPSMMFSLALILILTRFVPSRTLPFVTILLVTMLSLSTYERNKTWRSELTIYIDCVKKSPKKARPLVSLGNTLIIRQKVYQAIPILEKAVLLDTDNLDARNSLGAAYARTGNLSLAIEQFNLALQIDPTFIPAKENKIKAIQKQQKAHVVPIQPTPTN